MNRGKQATMKHDAKEHRRRSIRLKGFGSIIEQFKSITAKQINKNHKTVGAKIWQRNYYEHIIRNEKELNKIREYIYLNPANWETDEENRINRRNDTHPTPKEI
ncbi:MAG: hypothetical protein Kow0090_17180 [Myxococcota bacterium]